MGRGGGEVCEWGGEVREGGGEVCEWGGGEGRCVSREGRRGVGGMRRSAVLVAALTAADPALSGHPSR